MNQHRLCDDWRERKDKITPMDLPESQEDSRKSGPPASSSRQFLGGSVRESPRLGGAPPALFGDVSPSLPRFSIRAPNAKPDILGTMSRDFRTSHPKPERRHFIFS
jgi:hypothetical protein